MGIFLDATRNKVRFNTTRGVLRTEDLWDMKLSPLAILVRNLKKELKKDNDDELSFLDATATKVDKALELRFNIAKAIYIAKKEEKDASLDARAKKEHNEKIMALIAAKKEADLSNKSLEELEAMLSE